MSLNNLLKPKDNFQINEEFDKLTPHKKVYTCLNRVGRGTWKALTMSLGIDDPQFNCSITNLRDAEDFTDEIREEMKRAGFSVSITRECVYSDKHDLNLVNYRIKNFVKL